MAEREALVQQLTAALERLDALGPPAGAEALASMYDRLNALRDHLSDLRKDVQQALVVAVDEEGGAVILNGEVWETQRRWNRKAWDNDALRSAVARLAVATPDGEVRSGAETWAIVNEAFHLDGGKLRATWAKSAGIDPNDYAGETELAVTLRRSRP